MIKKILFIFFILVVFCDANDKLFKDSLYIPKILTYDLNYKDKIKKNKIKVAIICDKESQNLANILANQLFKTLIDKLNINQVDIELIMSNKYKEMNEYMFVYMFHNNNSNSIYQDIQKMGILSFCDDKRELSKGCAINIDNNTILYNKNVLNDSKIFFSTSFLKVIKNYE